MNSSSPTTKGPNPPWTNSAAACSRSGPPGTRALPLRRPTTLFGRLWRELFLVCRPAWAALAAVWVVTLSLHLAAADWAGAPDAAALAATPPGQDTLAALREQQQFLAQLLDLAPTGAPALAPRPGRRGESAALWAVV